MHKIILKICWRAFAVIAVFLIPSFLGAQLAGDIFKVFAIILFVSELTLVHFSIYLHRYFGREYLSVESFALSRRNIFILLAISIAFCTFILFMALSNYISAPFTLFSVLLLCITHAFGRLMIVIVDEAYYLILGDILPLIFASMVCILLAEKNVELFFLYKSLASIPYLIWCSWLLNKKVCSPSADLMKKWPMEYLKMFFIPVSFSALSFPFLNWFIFSRLSAFDAVQLRLSQALVGPITVVVANAKSAYLSSGDKARAVRLGFLFWFSYLFVTTPLFLVSQISGSLNLFGININNDVIFGFYIMSIPAFFTLKFIEHIVQSAYSLSRTRLALYQFIVAGILSLVAITLTLSSFIASVIFATHTLVVIFFIRKAS